MNIIQYPHKLLRTKLNKLNKITQETRDELDEMVLIMRASGGIGLAANQIGLRKRMCVLEWEGKVYKMINPSFISKSYTKTVHHEGCLSLKFYPPKEVIRAYEVTIKYKDENNNKRFLSAIGMLASIIQHEIDHLDGICICDKEEY